MLKSVFPETFDNRYGGQPLGLWLLFPILFVKIGISLVAIFRPDGGAQSADGIPLDSFSPAAAQAVIGVIAFLGLATLLTQLVGVMALIRYRAMVPLIYLLMVADSLGHRAIDAMKPVARAGGHPGGWVSLALILLIGAGFVLSLWRRGAPPDPRTATA